MLTPLYREREQTEVKHRCLERYLQAAARILGSWSDFVYVDCCAGPWRANGENLEDTSFSRAIQVLKVAKQDLAARSGRHPSIRCLLIEKDEEAYVQLDDYAKKQKEIEVVARHWDFSEHMDDIVRFVKRTKNSFPFVLIDPKGWELAYIDAIAPLLRLCPGEVLINLMTSFITRFIGDESKPFHRAVGAENLQRLRTLRGTEQEEAIVRAYCDQVRSAGSFNYVCDLPVMKPDQDAFHYYLIYGSRNIRGVEEFKATERAVVRFMHDTRAEAQEYTGIQRSGGQLTLPGFQSGLYRERRYTDFKTANLIRAKRRLHSLLQSCKEIVYEDVWGEAMQFGGVQPADLKGWLKSLEQAGKLVVPNRAPNERPFFYKKHHLLRYRGVQSHPETEAAILHRK
jgi:three-Cys-motif partner protein